MTFLPTYIVGHVENLLCWFLLVGIYRLLQSIGEIIVIKCNYWHVTGCGYVLPSTSLLCFSLLHSAFLPSRGLHIYLEHCSDFPVVLWIMSFCFLVVEWVWPCAYIHGDRHTLPCSPWHQVYQVKDGDGASLCRRLCSCLKCVFRTRFQVSVGRCCRFCLEYQHSLGKQGAGTCICLHPPSFLISGPPPCTPSFIAHL